MELSKTYYVKIADVPVKIIKTRPLLFAGFRPHNYKFFVNNKCVKEVEAL
jgi:hypothetical protein